MANQNQNDAFKPRWRHFHPQSVVWVQNILNHDVVFKVADEHDQQYEYVMPAGEVSELPGGAVATLGVKAIVDELCQNNKDDVLRIWDTDVRLKYEDEIILRIKDAPKMEERTIAGKINLGMSNLPAVEDEPDEPVVAREVEQESAATEEVAFSSVKKAAKAATAKLPATKELED